MNIAYGVLLLIIGGLTLWLLTESKIKWYVRTGCITAFCLFTFIFWNTVHGFLGWPARDSDLPDKVKIHWVVVKEPDKLTGDVGSIFILAEPFSKPKGNAIVRFFGYKKQPREPRQYGLPYNRKLHEQLAKNVIPKLKKGQPVFGKLTKGDKSGKKGSGSDPSQKSGGSESQQQGFEFHELRPSDFLEKPTD